MPEKQTPTAHYRIDGKQFVWEPVDDNDERGNLPAVSIPMRIKLKVIRGLADRDLNADAMFDILEAIIPNQAEALDEMDLNDFQDMFAAWQNEYQSLSGATLGE